MQLKGLGMDLLSSTLDEEPCTVTLAVKLTEKASTDWEDPDTGVKLSDPKHLPLTLIDSVDNISSEDIPYVVTQSSSGNDTFFENLSSEICFETIVQDQLGIDQVSSFISKPELSQETENNLSLPVYPDLLFLNDNVTPESQIDINNIQLYLECSDDNECALTEPSIDINNPNITGQNGTSLLKSDVQLKISFPVIQEEPKKCSKCSFCKKDFYQEHALRIHVEQEHQEKVHICPLCSYNTKSNKYYSNHLKTKHREILESTLNQSQNNRSVLLISDDQYFYNSHNNQCEADNVVLDTLRDYQSDINHQNCNLNIIYKESNNPVPTISTRKIAKNIGTHLQPYSSSIADFEACSECQFVTKSSKLLKIHQNTMHDRNRYVFKCSDCSYICKQKRSLLTHQKLHKGAYGYRCEICMKKFVSKAIHTRHLKTHILHRHFSCSFENCNKAFKSKGALTDHRKQSHNSDSLVTTSNTLPTVASPSDAMVGNVLDAETKESTCDATDSNVLDAGSQRTSNKATCTSTDKVLDNKINRVSVGELLPNSSDQTNSDSNTSTQKICTSKQKSQSKSFICLYPNCKKVFRDNFNLRNHLFVHEGVKNIHCTFCDFTCVQKGSLNYHIKMKHQENK